METLNERNQTPEMAHRPPAIGVDIGRVLVGGGLPGDPADSSFLSGDEATALAIPPIEGAFEGARILFERFEGRLWLVSKCGPRIEARTRLWLDEWRFYEATGMPREHLRFCRKRPEKRDHAVALGLTHFVDDRLDVLRHLEGAVPHRYRFGPARPDDVIGPQILPVPDWRAAVERIQPA